MTQNTSSTTTTQKPVSRRPNEAGTVQVEGFIRIFDPKTQQVFVEKRA
jgi:hypothetical protein